MPTTIGKDSVDVGAGGALPPAFGKGRPMASDYGDEAGSKMIDDFMRFGERMGERAMYTRASQMQRAFQNATQSAREAAGEAPAGNLAEWAKLDMHEFQGIEDYEAIKGIIEDRLAAHGVASTWFPDPETGREYLLFRIADAREVWQSFDELARETDGACAKAAEKLEAQRGKGPERLRDERTLDERAGEAREASKALEAEGATSRAKAKGPRLQEVRAK